MYRTDIVSGWGIWGLVDAPRMRFATTPAYRVTRLFNELIEPGWRADGQARSTDRLLLASRFSAVDRRDESVVVLNRDTRSREVRVDGLPAGRRFERTVWNRDGAGTVAPTTRVASSANGAVTITVPPRGVTAVSTRVRTS
jgi:hypothetical protein